MGMLYYEAELYEDEDGYYMVGYVPEIPISKDDALAAFEYGGSDVLHLFGEEPVPEGVEDIRPKIRLRAGEVEPEYVVAVLDSYDGTTSYYALIPAEGTWYYQCSVVPSNSAVGEWVCGEYISKPIAFESFDGYMYLNGKEYWVLGKDDLPEDVENIKGRVLNEMELLVAVREPDGGVSYFGFIEA